MIIDGRKCILVRSGNIIDFPSERMRGCALARSNGVTAAKYSVPLPRANPYRKGSRKWAAFLDGYRSASSGEGK